MRLTTPRLVIGAISGDSGKTLVSLGLVRALTGRGYVIAPFKKGPDYIDAAWLGAAARRPGRNLDTFLMEAAGLGEALARCGAADLILVEGNRGFHDGFDSAGSHSTATLARVLRSPVILVLDVTKMTRSAAAIVLGCLALDPDAGLAGVVLNRVGTRRQEDVIREAIGNTSGIPVLGAIPRLSGDVLPSRHLGLVTAAEHPQREAVLTWAAETVSEHVDLDAILALAGRAPAAEFPRFSLPEPGEPVRIGVFQDEAFSFYYPDNLESLADHGAEMVPISPLADRSIPDVDALLLGGGFPEIHVERLASNESLRSAVKKLADEGTPIFAECGGMMYLAKQLVLAGSCYPMAGALDLVIEMTSRPQGHGYVLGEVDRPNPFFPRGTVLRGHEFHHSRIVDGEHRSASVLRLSRGQGITAGRDALVVGRIWASYLHVHSLGSRSWASGLVGLARAYKRERAKRKAIESKGA